VKNKQEMLDQYDSPNQGTKREIIKYLYENPDMEHNAETIFEAIRNDCPAGTSDTVANQLSDLATNHDRIELQERSFYQWEGQGRRRPNRKLRFTVDAIRRWVDTLNISYGTALLAFVTWFIGILCALLSLIPLFTSVQPFGADFTFWFFWAGLMTILGSTVVMVWVPLYLLDVRTAK